MAQGRLRPGAGPGQPMIYLNIGEPDFTARRRWCRSAAACLCTTARTQYTQATGPAGAARAHQRLVRQRFRRERAAERIVVTAGARPRCSWPAWR
jgi:aspartate/methionine/tyrosine aminotransferase